MKGKPGKIFRTAYALNYISQAAFSMIFPAGLFCLLGWYLTAKKGFPDWAFAICIALGVIVGFYSMIKYLITMSGQLELAKKGKEDESGKGADENADK